MKSISIQSFNLSQSKFSSNFKMEVFYFTLFPVKFSCTFFKHSYSALSVLLLPRTYTRKLLISHLSRVFLEFLLYFYSRIWPRRIQRAVCRGPYEGPKIPKFQLFSNFTQLLRWVLGVKTYSF